MLCTAGCGAESREDFRRLFVQRAIFLFLLADAEHAMLPAVARPAETRRRASQRHGRAAQARPSGPWPVGILPETSSVCRSITATALSPASATYAREPSGTIRMPPGPLPTSSIFVMVLAAVSTITSSPAAGSEISANFPSGVNFRRLECLVRTLKVCVTLLVAVSITETVPSAALATQTSLSSGERSMPSTALPTGMFVSFQPDGSVLFLLAVTVP